MYRPAAFDVEDPGSLLTELLSQTAATLVTSGPEGLESTILPLMHDRSGGSHGTLIGHVARANPIVTEGHRGEVLVVVTGPAGYVSPSWYPSKAEHGRVVPTWDYVTVQAAGSLVVHHDASWLLRHVRALSDRHELPRSPPWSVDDAPDGFVDLQARGIVGIEVRLTRLAGKAKLSQNRPVGDVAGVIEGLRAESRPGDGALADAVESAARNRTAR